VKVAWAKRAVEDVFTVTKIKVFVFVIFVIIILVVFIVFIVVVSKP
jgi:hypothetical protein